MCGWDPPPPWLSNQKRGGGVLFFCKKGNRFFFVAQSTPAYLWIVSLQYNAKGNTLIQVHSGSFKFIQVQVNCLQNFPPKMYHIVIRRS